MESGLMVKGKVKGLCSGVMVKSIQGNFRMINEMGMVYVGVVGRYTKDNGVMIRSMEKEN